MASIQFELYRIWHIWFQAQRIEKVMVDRRHPITYITPDDFISLGFSNRFWGFAFGPGKFGTSNIHAG